MHEIARDGYAILTDFLSQAELTSIQADFDLHYQNGEFKSAGVGRGQSLIQDNQIRRDEILWLNPQEATTAQKIIWSKLATLQEQFNRNLFLGLREFEGHYAFYPPGGFYARHLDQFRTKDNHLPKRIVSFVLYLTPHWKPEDGGYLRLYLKNNTLDIEPRAGTLVVFLSAEVEHEVLANHSGRLSFTGWWKT